MALIIAVHGIGQQFKADSVIHAEWWPSLLGGLHLAGFTHIKPDDLACAFYGSLFRQPGALSAFEAPHSQNLSEQEQALLEFLWHSAVETEPKSVPAPADFTGGRTLAATPQIVQRALQALAKSSFCTGIAQNMMIGNLKQVVRYLNEPDIRRKAKDSVLSLMGPETRVVVAHSLGSVVAYEALCERSDNVKSFVTIGSPLGIPNLIFERLQPSPSTLHIGRWPGNIARWTNIADRGDIVANPKKLQPLFGDPLVDLPVNNGSDAHHGERYLTAVETGRAIAEGLWTAS
jgi:hypothetical protein